jgi:hypothetical protein
LQIIVEIPKFHFYSEASSGQNTVKFLAIQTWNYKTKKEWMSHNKHIFACLLDLILDEYGCLSNASMLNQDKLSWNVSKLSINFEQSKLG